MATFQSKRYVTRAQKEAFDRTWRGRYLNNVEKHSFLLLGLPFFSLLFAATYFLSFATQIRYDQHDKKVTQLSEEEAFKVLNNKRPVDMRDEFYRLQKMDFDSWEQKRVPRLPGQSENKWSPNDS